ncbi:MAG: polysaccharide deacetylase family protein [Fimbriimonadaceae bacterium]
MSLRLPILCYHKVGPEAEEGRWLNIEPHRFETHIRYFARRRAFIHAGDTWHPDSWSRASVCVTFDDAYASTVLYAPMILYRYKAVATLFVVPGKVGKTSDWDGDLARPLADWHALKEAVALGMEIGNHTMSHRRLPWMDRREQQEEMEFAAAALEDKGHLAVSIAYPYGDADDVTEQVAMESGARVAFGLGKRQATPEDRPFCVPRIPIAFSDALPMLLYRVFVRGRRRDTRRVS